MSIYSNQQSGDSSTPQPAVFVARHDNAKTLASMLNVLSFKGMDDGKKKDNNINIICICDERGIRFILEHAKQYQANVHFKSDSFSTYLYTPNEYGRHIFKLNLPMLMDCLNIFGNHSGHSGLIPLNIYFNDTLASPFVIVLLDGDVRTTCQLKTMDSELPLDFTDLDDGSQPTNSVMINSETLLEAFATLDYCSDTVSIQLVEPNGEKDPNIFRLSTGGTMGEYSTTYREGMFEYIDCKQNLSFRYPLPLIQPCVKALAVAKQTRITMGANGLLRFQNFILIDDKKQLVEYLITAQQDDDDVMYFN